MNNQGWISINFLFALPIFLFGIILTIVLNFFLHQEMHFDKVCRIEQREIMKYTRNQIDYLIRLNPLAESLNKIQTGLRPFLWIPKVYAVYKAIENLRKSFDFLQTSFIQFSNFMLQIKTFSLYKKLRDSLIQSQTRFKNYYQLNFILFPMVPITLALRRKKNYLFPPYELVTNFTERQSLSINSKITQTPRGIFRYVYKESLHQKKQCKASLSVKSSHADKIIYYAKNISFTRWSHDW